MKKILVIAAFAVLIAGCRAPEPMPPWPEIDETAPVDVNVAGPEWHKLAVQAAEWSPGPQPDFATAEWRRWVTLKNASRAIVRKQAAAQIEEAAKWPAVKGVFFDDYNLPAFPQTTIRFAHDGQRLFIVLQCAEPQKDILEQIAEYAPGQKDRVVLELSTDSDNPWAAKMVISVESSGLIQKAAIKDRDLSKEIESVAATSEGSWGLMIKIPLSTLELPADGLNGRTLACRIARYRYSGEKPQMSFWTRLQEAGPVWGFLKFEDEPEKKEPEPEAKPEK